MNEDYVKEQIELSKKFKEKFIELVYLGLDFSVFGDMEVDVDIAMDTIEYGLRSILGDEGWGDDE